MRFGPPRDLARRPVANARCGLIPQAHARDTCGNTRGKHVPNPLMVLLIVPYDMELLEPPLEDAESWVWA
eukprot:7996878-Alexandrium_andersonii.AAC.1